MDDFASQILERDRYDVAYARLERRTAALRKIAAWHGYATHADRLGVEVLTEYETGANDMLATLKQMAEEALA